MISSRARFARMFFGCNERVLAWKWSGGIGENPIALSNNKTAAEKISMGADLRTVQRTYFLVISKSQSCCGAGDPAVDPGAAGETPGGPRDKMSVLRPPSRTNKNRIEHIKRPATKMPIAMSTPSCEKLMAPLSTSARKPTAVVRA